MTGKFPFIENEFIGKCALVTGGTAGIGQAVVNRLLDGWGQSGNKRAAERRR
jgi:NAD(P)-dependent dehydrogenase (short-subunit alcohol dehydrogenase family)